MLYSLPAYSRISTTSGSFSLTKEPCIEKEFTFDIHVYDRIKRYSCYSNNTVAREEFLNKTIQYDRRGRIAATVERKLSGEVPLIVLKKTYFITVK